MLNLLCLGLNHRVAPVGVRERYAFSEEEVRRVLLRLKAAGVAECALLATCNRTELYVATSPGGPSERELWALLANGQGSGGEDVSAHVYAIHALRAAQHLFKVASGVDSMVLGDVQIMNQVKAAYALAQSCGTTGTILNKLFPSALHAGKRARAETDIGEGAVSVGYAAAELASKIFRDLRTKTALLIGAGETGELTAQHLVGHGLGRLRIANRTQERAEQLAAKMRGEVVAYASIGDALAEADIVVASVSAPGFVLERRHLEEARRRRGASPLVVIDIGVPRNVEPAAGGLDGVFLHDIDSLHQIVDRNLERRAAELPRVRAIVFQELLAFDHWHGTLELNPTIQELRAQFEEIRAAEVARLAHRFDASEQEDVAILTKRIVSKLLHTPMVTLRGDPGKGHEVREEIRLVRALFGLDA